MQVTYTLTREEVETLIETAVAPHATNPVKSIRFMQIETLKDREISFDHVIVEI